MAAAVAKATAVLAVLRLGDHAVTAAPARNQCQFVNEPVVPYYWDPQCELGKLGCWADGVSVECRFCGNYPYTSIPCPGDAQPPALAGCSFDFEPGYTYNYDPTCEIGMPGCGADGKNIKCRYCGQGEYADIPCDPLKKCQFANEPEVPYYWEPQCWKNDAHILGCNADGIHQECRFCRVRPFETIPCPADVEPTSGVCTWGLEPSTPHFWDPTCEMGMLGCWADGIHAQCRFCGEDAYSSIACPSSSTTVLLP